MAKPLEEAIGYRFRDHALLEEALSHRSYASESRSPVYNERLEFLGDSILSAVVAHELYLHYPNEKEGALSKKRSQLVSRPNLAKWAQDLDIGSYLYLGVGEESSGGRLRQSLLANSVEALIGAVYLDGGYESAAAFIRRYFTAEHGTLVETDYKSRLQELLQRKYRKTPDYAMSSFTGPDHDRTFEVEVRLGKKALGRGLGKSKKEAEQAAAKDAIDSI